LAHLKAAQRPWDVYEIMPRDNREIFASLTDQEKEAMLPADSRQEYLQDGKGDSVRQLRDYQVAFSILHLRRTLLVDELAATSLDLKLVKDALAQAEQQEAAAKKDVEDAKIEVELAARERDAVATFLKTVEKDYEAAKAAIDGLIKANKDMAGRIATLQLEAARQIDQRTRAMARSGTGG
jgi:hypoxanthine phosphoribosyltransferase